jgi:hypothetical protein
MPILCQSRNWIFVSNPKAASTSIEATLGTFQDRPDLDELTVPGFFTRRHAPALVLRTELGLRGWERLYSFAVVRDPRDWFVSQLIYNRERFGDFDTSTPLGEADVLDVCRLLSFARGQEASPSATQWAFLCDADRRVLTSDLWRLDNLGRTWKVICRRLGVPFVALPSINRTSHPSAANWLSSQAQQTLRRIYATDFDLYDSAR